MIHTGPAAVHPIENRKTSVRRSVPGKAESQEADAPRPDRLHPELARVGRTTNEATTQSPDGWRDVQRCISNLLERSADLVRSGWTRHRASEPSSVVLEPSRCGLKARGPAVPCRSPVDVRGRLRYNPGRMPTPSQAVAPLETPLTSLSGVGPERSAQLARLGLFTVGDLFLHAPRRHEDRRHLLRIAELQSGVAGTTRGTIVAQGLKTFRQRSRSVFEIVLDDGTGRLHCRWWNLPFMERYFKVGDEVMVFGKLKAGKPRTIDHPESEIIEAGEELSIHIDRIAPIYPLTEGLPQRWLRSLVWRTLQKYGSAVAELQPGLDRLNRPELVGLPSRPVAVQQLHFPKDLAEVEQARGRLAFDEFLELQLAIQRRRRNLEANARALPCGGDQNRLIKPFLRQLGFELTGAQARVLREIRADLAGPHPMRRLIQGDVGSGKTAVAACSALMAMENRFNVALMAPTEILANQHFETFRRWFEPHGLRVELQTASRKTREPAASGPGLDPAPRPADAPSLFVGTHALIESAFNLDRLGLVIIDEQHKFGVSQRETLVRKGHYPHLLVMTATPIPRTLGLTVYGDLDCSVIDELPVGRGEVKTHVRPAARLPKVHRFIKDQLAAGRQAYVVYPRVDESDPAAGVKAVTKERDALAAYFAPHQVAMLHGRMPADEKDAVMADFRANRIQLLLATTVIEVGVDVPNATVMLIENADTFGLAQLHQLRGRIGRGAHESHCILMQASDTDDARERLTTLASTNDGFAIAEADLRMRGPGELLGQQQSGLPSLKFGDLRRDRELIERARRVARDLVRANPPSAGVPTIAR